MRKSARILTAVLALLSATSTISRAQGEAILAGFSDPSSEYRPKVWWHWADGNVSKDGIRKDLFWLKSVGIGGVQNFDVSVKAPTIVPERVKFGSPEWKDAMGYAVRLADSLGLDFGLQAASGWSDTGGPWVRPEDAMKTLNWKEFTIDGGRHVSEQLPEPNAVCGKYLTHSFFDPPRPEFDFYRDIAVLAVRISDRDLSMEELGAKVTSSDGTDVSSLSDGDINNRVIVHPGEDGRAWIQYEFPKEVTLKSFLSCRKDDWKSRTGRIWQVSSDGVNFMDYEVRMPATRTPFITVDVTPASGRFFRLTAEKEGEDFDYTELRVYPVTKVNLDTEKAGFFTNISTREFYPTPATDDAAGLGDIIDVSGYVKDGKLNWDAPEGRWRIYRFGYTIRGRMNNPATPEAKGLETDKLSAAVTKSYYDTYFSIFNEATDGQIGGAISQLVTDSFEAGCQTWTDGMETEFEKRRGYALRQWLPALAGAIVESSEATEQFLRDWRTTLGEMIVEYHYDSLGSVMKKYGLQRYSEFHESGRAFPTDGMDIKKGADVPMAAFWINSENRAYPRNESDVKEAASVAHIYGQNVVAAESFSTTGTEVDADGCQLFWSITPKRMKTAADQAMASGLNSFVMHCSIHQPMDDRIPGITLEYYGLWFQRHETWAHEAKAFTDYLARSSYLLRQGRYVADIAYFYSELTNVTERFNNGLPDVPEGFSFDFVNSTVLCDIGISGYKALIIDNEATRMSLKTLRAIEKYADAGGIVAGSEPKDLIGLSESRTEFERLVRSIWHSDRSNVVSETSLDRKLRESGAARDLVLIEDSGNEFRWLHRKLDDGELYWVANLSPKSAECSVSLNVVGKKPMVLHADSGLVEPASYCMENGRTTVRLSMVENDAQFILLTDDTAEKSLVLKRHETELFKVLEGGWEVAFQKGRGAPSNIELSELSRLDRNMDKSVRYFSGTAVYTKRFKLAKVSGKREFILDLGEVHDIARVRINGVDCGCVWKSPYTVSAAALKKGWNTIEIEVTNAWANRLIGDCQPGSEPITWTSYNVFEKDEPLRASGLEGPVKIMCR